MSEFRSTPTFLQKVSVLTGLSPFFIFQRIPLSPDSGNKENEIDDEVRIFDFGRMSFFTLYTEINFV